jgi:hypothetical protein
MLMGAVATEPIDKILLPPTTGAAMARMINPGHDALKLFPR